MASGSPSRRRTMVITSGAGPGVEGEVRCDGRRAVAEEPDGWILRCLDRRCPRRGENPVGGSGPVDSPVRPKGSRLVANTEIPGATATMSPTSSAAAVIRCSQLSITSSPSSSRKASSSRS